MVQRTHRREAKRRAESITFKPSAVWSTPSGAAAMYATTVSTFAVGLLIDVPHLRHFFASCILCMSVVLGLQYTVFPLCIRKCVDASEEVDEGPLRRAGRAQPERRTRRRAGTTSRGAPR